MNRYNHTMFVTATLGLITLVVSLGLMFLFSKNTSQGEVLYSDSHTTIRKVEIEGHEYLINSRGGIEKLR